MEKNLPTSHISRILNDSYYRLLLNTRNALQMAIHEYFQLAGFSIVDLYMICQGVSSPMGLGSDSEVIPIPFGSKEAFMVDSAQFGLEPFACLGEKVYCYLPSFRGEKPDNTHLNQFYHAEAEIPGTLEDVISEIESLLFHLAKRLESQSLVQLSYLDNFTRPIRQITFDDAVKILDNNCEFVDFQEYGRNITKAGEIELCKILGNIPLWVIKYDRDVVPFYQQPDSNQPDKVLNADLLVPANKTGLGGEILGCGQRQSTSQEIIVSMKRQGVENIGQYDWYLNLRNEAQYKTTSGFGLGIERFLAYLLDKASIAEVCLYPVAHNLPLF
jgi:asparaginyl-tRNA synthetase